MGLFGKKESAPERPAGRASTNAPRTWPGVTMKAWADNPGINLIMVTGQLMDAFKGADAAFMDDRVYPDGILRIPFRVTTDGQTHAVYTYAKADTAAAAHFSGVRSVLRQREQINAVYFAPASLTPAAPANVLEPLDTPHFSRPGKDRGDAEYALWWPVNGEGLQGSPALEHLDRWFEATDGYATLLFSSFVRVLELAKKEDGKPTLFGLPQQRLLEPVDGPGRTRLYLQASEAEGLWLAFDTRTDAARRDTMLKLLADLAVSLKAAAVARRIPPFPNDIGGLRYWHAVRARAIESGSDPTLRFGRVAIQGDSRVIFTKVTTGAAREAALPRAQANESLFARVREALDAAVRVAAKPNVAEDSLTAPGESGLPNFHPLLLTWKDGHVQQASLHMMEAPEAIGMVPAAVRGRGGADAAVLVWDGIVREGEGRTDAILARAQERGQPRSTVVAQLYRPRRKGQPFALLGNFQVHGEDEAILPAEDVAPAPPPPLTPELDAHLRQSLHSMVQLFTVGDPTAAKNYRRSEAMWSPCMYLLKDGGKSICVNFAMSSGPRALAAAPRMVAQEAGTTMAVFVYDHDLSVDGQPARELRFVAHARGMAQAALYAQSYMEPDPSRPFTLVGDLRPLSAGPALVG